MLKFNTAMAQCRTAPIASQWLFYMPLKIRQYRRGNFIYYTPASGLTSMNIDAHSLHRLAYKVGKSRAFRAILSNEAFATQNPI